jgi:hypothetical protein
MNEKKFPDKNVKHYCNTFTNELRHMFDHEVYSENEKDNIYMNVFKKNVSI